MEKEKKPNLNDYDKKKYWWIKLSENFMSGEIVDYILAQKDGSDYVMIYLMLVMLAINKNGKLCLTVNGIDIPFDDQKLQRDLKHWSIDTVRTAINALVKLDLLYYDAKKILSISNFKELVGSETRAAKRQREWREQNKGIESKDNNKCDNVTTLECDNVTTLECDSVTQEIRDKDIRDKDINKTGFKKDNDFNKSIKGIEEAEYSATKKLFNDAVITTDMIGAIDDIFNKSNLNDYVISLIVNDIMQFSKGKIYNPIAYFNTAFPKQEYLWKTLGNKSSDKFDLDPDDYKEIIENAKKVWFNNAVNEGGNE